MVLFWRWVRSAAGSATAFGVVLAVAAPLIVLYLGAHRWFFGDEWVFLTGRGAGSPAAVLHPYNGHWVSVPLVVFRSVFEVFGIQSYRPYLVVIVLAHLAVVALSRAVLRHLDVHPWPATLVVLPLVLFGPGADDIVWAFQLAFTGALLFGLAHLLVVDHDGRPGLRDGAGVVLGLLALACSAVALPLIAANLVVVLVRRGWRVGLLHAAPLTAVFLAWTVAADPKAQVEVVPPPLATSVAWVRHAVSGTVLEVGGGRVVAIGLLVLVAVGWILAVDAASRRATASVGGAGGPGGGTARRAVLLGVARDLVIPVALVGALLGVALLTARTRWTLGVGAARSSRYLYVYLVLLLPTLGIAVQAVIDRWRALVPVVVVLLLAGTPGNATPTAFVTQPFGEPFFAGQRRVATTIVRLPEARQVPGRTTLVQGPLSVFSPTIGFLLDEVDGGRLAPSEGPFRPLERGDLVLRLALVAPPAATPTCPDAPAIGPYAATQTPEVGARYGFDGTVVVTLLDDAEEAISAPAAYSQTPAGLELVVQLPDLRLRLAAGPGGSVRSCPG